LHTKKAAYLRSVKLEPFHLDVARTIAEQAIHHVDKMYDDFIAANNIEINKDVDALLDDVQHNIMKIAIKKEIGD
jgi:hypothetical protein